jgi:hypothetical protein
MLAGQLIVVNVAVSISPTLSLWDVPALEIARQLTLIEFERFKAIRASELFGQAWSSARNRYLHAYGP